MKIKNIIFTAITLCLLIGTMGCEDETYAPPSDPKQAILGKWELIEIGFQNHTEPYQDNRYIEYLPDSALGWYYYDTKEYTVSNIKYWIDTILHEKQIREDGHKIITEYTYQFYEDKMRLEYIDLLAIYDVFIYQRKK
ncbi:MAG: hypothetical protein PHQ11_09590 [Paludibacter sp.]|nr:hypothetical protein [Paludibacter sp.]MDD4199475.1 hypothetical protein [Paludibacter sp.]MDD4427169.1 hypothetical protein [Paludibacter sp.]